MTDNTEELRAIIRVAIKTAIGDAVHKPDPELAEEVAFHKLDQYATTLAERRVREAIKEQLWTLDDIANKPWRAIRYLAELFEENIDENPDYFKKCANEYRKLEAFYSNGGSGKIDELLADPDFNKNYPDMRREIHDLDDQIEQYEKEQRTTNE